MEHIGIDVHKNQSQICILTREGELIEKRIVTERRRFAAVLGSRPRARILIEASTESEWVARCLEALGHEVVVGDPNYSPMYGRRTRRVKTDRRDARALAEACRSGTYRPAHRTSDERRHLRGRLAVREALVRTRARYISLIRALLRQERLRVRSGEAEKFLERLTVFFGFRTWPASSGEGADPDSCLNLFQNDISVLLFLDLSGPGMEDVSHIFREAGGTAFAGRYR